MIHELLVRERSYRSFDPSVNVSKETLLAFLENVRLTPSTRNLQALKFKLCTEQKDLEMMLASTWWAKSLPVKLPTEGHAPTAYIIICLDTSIASADIMYRDVGIAAQTIMLSAVEAGLGGCMIGSFVPETLSKHFAFPEHIVPKLVIGLGKPDEVCVTEDSVDGNITYYRDGENVHHVPKRTLEEILL